MLTLEELKMDKNLIQKIDRGMTPEKALRCILSGGLDGYAEMILWPVRVNS